MTAHDEAVRADLVEGVASYIALHGLSALLGVVADAVEQEAERQGSDDLYEASHKLGLMQLEV